MTDPNSNKNDMKNHKRLSLPDTPAEELKKEIISWMHKGIQRGKTIPIFEEMVERLEQAARAEQREADALAVEKKALELAKVDFYDFRWAIDRMFELASAIRNSRL